MKQLNCELFGVKNGYFFIQDTMFVLTSRVVNVNISTYWFCDFCRNIRQCFQESLRLEKFSSMLSISLFLRLLVVGAKNSDINTSSEAKASSISILACGFIISMSHYLLVMFQKYENLTVEKIIKAEHTVQIYDTEGT